MLLYRSCRFAVVGAVCCLIALSGWQPTAAYADDFSPNASMLKEARESKGSPLYKAALTGNVAKVKRLIAARAKVNAGDVRHRTPLHAAVLGGNIEVVKLLLTAGSKVNAVNDTRNGGCLIFDDGMTGTPLHWAAQTGNVAIARLLIQHGANVNSPDARWKETPLHLVGWQGGARMAELLIQHGARLDPVGGFTDATPLYCACEFDKVETAGVLLAHGADVNAAAEYGDTPLHTAVRTGNVALVKLLLTKRVNLNAESHIGTMRLMPSGFSNEIGGTPLHIANQMQKWGIVSLLQAKGATDTERDERGFSHLRP